HTAAPLTSGRDPVARFDLSEDAFDAADLLFIPGRQGRPLRCRPRPDLRRSRTLGTFAEPAVKHERGFHGPVAGLGQPRVDLFLPRPDLRTGGEPVPAVEPGDLVDVGARVQDQPAVGAFGDPV